MSDAKNPQRQATVDHRDAGQPQAAGAAGNSPSPGNAHDDSKTVTTDQGPPVERTDGVPGAGGEGSEVDNQAGR